MRPKTGTALAGRTGRAASDGGRAPMGRLAQLENKEGGTSSNLTFRAAHVVSFVKRTASVVCFPAAGQGRQGEGFLGEGSVRLQQRGANKAVT